MLAKILLPVDFSDRCLAATRHMIRFAERFHSEITLVHVVPSSADLGSSESGRKVSPRIPADWETPPPR